MTHVRRDEREEKKIIIKFFSSPSPDETSSVKNAFLIVEIRNEFREKI